ncbi:hypothetical protein [Bacillus alveayuensis]|uniref:hypothetical protein n=1 Tax=Aeribacillus alveayuensis TaxID=279215 RepID=UPI0005D1263D|nr:hypothetical protein [Bacillus alveayuensis]
MQSANKPAAKEKFCINCGCVRKFVDGKEGVERTPGKFFCSHCGVYESYNEVLRDRRYGASR